MSSRYVKKMRSLARGNYRGGVEGGATEQEISDFAAAVSSGGSDWGTFTVAIHNDAFTRYLSERMRCLNANTFHDGDNGAFFVIVVNAILSNINETSRRCAYRLMSMDPLTTFFILTDPQRQDSTLNDAIKAALSKGIPHQSRSDAKAAYHQHFTAACASVAGADSAADKCRQEARSLISSGGSDPMVLHNFISKCYKDCCGDGKLQGCEFCCCLSPATRSRLEVYDAFRLEMFNVFTVLYPSNDVPGVLDNDPFIKTEESRHRTLRSVVESVLKSTSTVWSNPSALTISINKFQAFHFILSDAFLYTPSTNGSTSSIAAVKAAMSSSSPFSFNACYAASFDSIF